jgi:hypothetical protein
MMLAHVFRGGFAAEGVVIKRKEGRKEGRKRNGKISYGRRTIGGEKIIITTSKIEDWLCL